MRAATKTTRPGAPVMFRPAPMNAKLPIPFDAWSELEPDLWCPQLKLAIEIDGPQHLADPAAYRRDRRKDRTRMALT